MSSDEINWENLRIKAKEVAKMAYAPYSNFPVGAAGLTDSGEIVTGCNVENASIGTIQTNHCDRSAVTSILR